MGVTKSSTYCTVFIPVSAAGEKAESAKFIESRRIDLATAIEGGEGQRSYNCAIRSLTERAGSFLVLSCQRKEGRKKVLKPHSEL